MWWNALVYSFCLFDAARTSHITFYGRSACSEYGKFESCDSETYAAQAFYYGKLLTFVCLMDGGGMMANGTFRDSDVRVEFFDPTKTKKIPADSFKTIDGTTGIYTDAALDFLLKESDSDKMLAMVGYESDCSQISALSVAYDRASLMGNCYHQVGEDNTKDSSLVQMAVTQGAKYRALGKALKEMGWTNVAVVNFENDGKLDNTYHAKLLDALSAGGVSVDYIKKGGFSVFSGIYTGAEKITQVLLESYLKTRIYIVVTNRGTEITMFMDCMSTLGLLESGQYFVINVGTIDMDTILYFNGFSSQRGSLGYSTTRRNIPPAQIRQYYRSYFYMTDHSNMIQDYNENWINFQERISKDQNRTFCPPLCDRNEKNIRNSDPWGKYKETVSVSIPNSYDLGKLISETIAVHGANLFLDPHQLTQTMRNRSVETLLGYVAKFDVHGIAQREYLLWSGQSTNEGYGITNWGTIAGRITPDGNGGYTVSMENVTKIGVVGGKLPKSRPKCGFNMELCPSGFRALTEIQIVIIAVAFAIAVIIAGFIAYLVRWIAYERKLDSSYFLVNRKDVLLYDITKFTSSRNGSMMQSNHSMRSLYGTDGMPEPTLQFYEQGMRAAYKRRRKTQKLSLPSNKGDWKDIFDWHLAKFDSALVTVRKIDKPALRLTREMKQELDHLMTEHHDNLNKFYGIIIESDLIFTIHNYGPRKCLNDLLRNDDLRLDRMFKVSFVEDISKGLHFLHEKSKIGYHGNLKSTNCVVDAYWRIKLNNFGMEKIRADEPTPKPDDMLWLAPELVRRFCVKHDLSKEELRRCDIYSFAIVVFEVYGRMGPYGDDFLDTSEVIEQIKYPAGGAITRPDIHLITKSPPVIIALLEKCWSENPADRPSIKKVRGLLKPLTQGFKGNIADNIMQLLDRYRFNLEDVIKERTEQLEEERRRNESLLLQLLPRTVALDLKNGKPVEAEYFEAVSIYFSDIVGFTSLSSKSTPMQIVSMLNELYTNFDSIIDCFDCYKVETIGDAYMFVSGLPEKNDILHAGEVAGASMELLNFIRAFSVPHCPEEKLKLRIGIHTGSVVTGVVGIRMPRYCLFGDSVITANNMESSGEAMRVQVSHETYDLLVGCTGYEMELRGPLTLKNKVEVTAYWLLSYSREARVRRLVAQRRQYPQFERLLMRLTRQHNK